MGEASFQIYKDHIGKFRFRLVAPNGEIIAVSESYESKEALVALIENVKKSAPTAEILKSSV